MKLEPHCSQKCQSNVRVGFRLVDVLRLVIQLRSWLFPWLCSAVQSQLRSQAGFPPGHGVASSSNRDYIPPFFHTAGERESYFWRPCRAKGRHSQKFSAKHFSRFIRQKRTSCQFLNQPLAKRKGPHLDQLRSCLEPRVVKSTSAEV